MPDNARISAVFLGIASGDAHPSFRLNFAAAHYDVGSGVIWIAKTDFARLLTDLLRIAGKDSLDRLKGAHVRMENNGARIGHIIYPDWIEFCDYTLTKSSIVTGAVPE